MINSLWTLRTPVILLLALLTPAPGTSAEEEAVSRIVLLQTGTEEERIRAARWLGLHGVEEAKAELWRIATATESTELQTVARLMLRLLEDPDLLQLPDADAALRGLDDLDPSVRAVAVRHVPYFGFAAALPRIAELLGDAASVVRAEAVTAVAYLDRDDRYRDDVLLLLDDSDPLVVRHLEGYLWTHQGPDLVEWLAALTAHPERAANAVAMLRRWGYTERTLKALLDQLAGHDDPEVTSRILAALEQLAPEEPVVQDWQAILSPLMERSEARIRLPAARLLLRAGNREAVPVLQEGLKNADLEDRRANARALAAASITDRRLISQLLEDPDIEIRRTALDLAVNLAPVRARAILREVLQSPTQEPDVQTKALFLLQDLGDAEDVEMILDLAHGTESDFVAVNTIMALGRIEGRLRTQRSLPYFREILEDPDADHALVSGVITALQEIGDDSFLPLLAHRLRHCAGACWSLGPELSSTIGILLGRRLHGTTFGRPEPQP